MPLMTEGFAFFFLAFLKALMRLQIRNLPRFHTIAFMLGLTGKLNMR